MDRPSSSPWISTFFYHPKTSRESLHPSSFSFEVCWEYPQGSLEIRKTPFSPSRSLFLLFSSLFLGKERAKVEKESKKRDFLTSSFLGQGKLGRRLGIFGNSPLPNGSAGMGSPLLPPGVSVLGQGHRVPITCSPFPASLKGWDGAGTAGNASQPQS